METKSMDVDLPAENNRNASSKRENHLVAVPVSGGSSGAGLPYAPEDWPNPGDIWRWKVGNRKCLSGHWVDRCVIAPSTCPRFGGKKPEFHSRLSLEKYIKKEFPQADLNTFFSSFIWRVPCGDSQHQKGMGNEYFSSRKLGMNDRIMPDLEIKPGDCKAGNMKCNERTKNNKNTSVAKDCDICCAEVGFCGNCCCILCCKTVDWAHDGCSFLRCEASLDDHYICGHVAHVECALRSYMAGTVGGSIGLDVEYYCRRCDNKTDLFPHVTKLLKVCESIDSREDMEKILNLGFCILRGSEQKKAKSLQDHIGLVIAKLERGVHLDEIWEIGDNTITPPAGDMDHEKRALGAEDNGTNESQDDCANDVEAKNPVHTTSDYSIAPSAKLESEIYQVLKELKKSQELEYGIAEQKLYVQKDFLLSLYRQLEYERSELTDPMQSSHDGNYNSLMSSVDSRVDQIKNEEDKLKKMMKIKHGFGRAPKSILADHFGLPVDD